MTEAETVKFMGELLKTSVEMQKAAAQFHDVVIDKTKQGHKANKAANYGAYTTKAKPKSKPKTKPKMKPSMGYRSKAASVQPQLIGPGGSLASIGRGWL